MPKATRPRPRSTQAWTPTPDSSDHYSSGIADLDRLLGGGFGRGTMALFAMDESVGPADRELLLTPTLLNFLAHSNGVLTVLPARESPRGFRAHLTRWLSRRKFDTRVRVVDYVGEDSEAPYVVSLNVRPPAEGAAKKRRVNRDMAKMVAAEAALGGKRAHPFVEMVAFEILEMVVGPVMATRMFFHRIKRTRSVGGLCLGLLRPGLACADAVRGMADVEIEVRRNELGLIVRGIRPAFASHLVVADPGRGSPHVTFLPAT